MKRVENRKKAGIARIGYNNQRGAPARLMSAGVKIIAANIHQKYGITYARIPRPICLSFSRFISLS